MEIEMNCIHFHAKHEVNLMAYISNSQVFPKFAILFESLIAEPK